MASPRKKRNLRIHHQHKKWHMPSVRPCTRAHRHTHTFVCIANAISTADDITELRCAMTTVTSRCQIFTRLLLWKTACEDTIVQMIRPCRMLCAVCCRGRRATLTGSRYSLLFEGERRMLRKMETVVRSNYTFSCVVLKFCEICLK